MVPSVGGNLVVFPPNVPTMEVVEIAGRAVDPGAGPVTVGLPFGTSPGQTVKVRARNFVGTVPFNVVFTPQNGPLTTVRAEFTADGSPIEVTVPASLPVNTESTVHVWSGPGIR